MSKIIIGIHGLGNKPPKDILENWWRESIVEGLQNNNYKPAEFDFELAYWADVLHEEPLKPDETDKESETYLSEPYVPFVEKVEKKEYSFREQALEYLEKYSDKILVNGVLSFNISSLTDMFIHRHFRDLEIYYSLSFINYNGKKRLARDVIIERLTDLIKKHKNKEILLVAHSMGSIIAYDALMDYVPEIKINTLLTIGSPLAQKYVIEKINNEKKSESETKLPVPENICSQWINLYDLEDVVAINYNLADYFTPNSNGITIHDEEIENNYSYNEKENPHKSYGYLRTDKFSSIINSFFEKKEFSFKNWVKKIFG
jgi:hypothetical protein